MRSQTKTNGRQWTPASPRPRPAPLRACADPRPATRQRPARGFLPGNGGRAAAGHRRACAAAPPAPSVWPVLTRYRGLFLPARQGLLGADDARGRVAHPRDGKEAVEEEELASPPGGREHGRAPAEGRSRGTALPAAEPPPELQRVGSAAGTGGRQGRGRARGASVELRPPVIEVAQGQDRTGCHRGRVPSPGRGCGPASSRGSLGTKFSGRELVHSCRTKYVKR